MRHLQIWSHWIFLMCDRREKYIENWTKINYLSNDCYAWHIDILSTFFYHEIIENNGYFSLLFAYHEYLAGVHNQVCTCIHPTGWYLALVNKFQHVLLLHAIYYQLLTWPSVERFCLKNPSEFQAKIHLFKWVPLKPFKTIVDVALKCARFICAESQIRFWFQFRWMKTGLIRNISISAIANFRQKKNIRLL